MMRKMQLYRTDVSGRTPSSENLEYGELAINYCKGTENIFFKNTDNEIVKVKEDLSNLVTNDEFETVSNAALNSIQIGSLGTVNGQSLEDGDVTIDMSLYIITQALPTENIQDNKIYLVPNAQSTESGNTFNEYLYNTQTSQFELFGTITPKVDLNGYLKTTDADNRYLKASSATNSAINVDNKGAMANFSDNGQAYLAVRPKGAKFLINTPYAGASFGVKDDGTAAFTHKTYATYSSTDGAYTGAKNTAVLQFAGPTGLRYAKNSGSANDVTDAMYKYVGVIDSPDEFQRVYSASQVDALLQTYTDEIAKLKQAIINLGGTID